MLSDNSAKIRNKLAAELLNQLMPIIANFEDDTLESYLDEWRSYDCMKGNEVDIFMGPNVFTGIIEGIDNNGMLLLAQEQGTIKAFASGEVSFRKS